MMNAINDAGKEVREEAITSLYLKVFPAVARHISRRGGSFDDAKDVFHDALVIYYEKSVEAKQVIRTNETAYLIGTAKHLWLKRFNENIQNTELEGFDLPNEDVELPDEKRVLHFLEKAGHKCMQLLKSFYYDQLPLKEIAETFGFSGVRSATVQKYKCLEKVRETIKQKALAYEYFME